MAGTVQKGVFGIAASFFLARLLRPEELGAYFLVFSLVGIAAAVAQLGLHRVVVRFVAESMAVGQAGRAKQVLRLVFLHGTLGALLAAVLLAGGLGSWFAQHVFHSGAMQGVMGLAALWVVAMTLQTLIAESFRGFHDIRLAVLFGGLSTSSLSVVLLSLVWWWLSRASLDQVVVLLLGATAVSVLLGGVLLRRRSAVLGDRGAVTARELRTAALPIWLSSLMFLVVAELGIWIVGGGRTTEEAALFGAAVRLAAFLAMPLSVVNAVVPPIIAELYTQRRRTELEEVLRSGATLAALPSLLLLVFLALFSEPVLGIIYGDYYRQAGVILMLLCVGQLANVWSGSCGFALMMTGNQTILLWIVLLHGILTALGGFLVVGSFGGQGVACVVALALALRSLLMVLAVRIKTGIWTHAGLNPLKAFRRLRSA